MSHKLGRISIVGRRGGYNGSRTFNPHATLQALRKSYADAVDTSHLPSPVRILTDDEKKAYEARLLAERKK